MLIQHPKQYVAGNGLANKKEVIKGLKYRFGFDGIRNDNIADALAIGLTYYAYLKFKATGKVDCACDGIILRQIDRQLDRLQDNLSLAEELKAKPKPKRRRCVKASPDKFYFKIGTPRSFTANTEMNISKKLRRDLEKEDKAKAKADDDAKVSKKIATKIKKLANAAIAKSRKRVA